MIRAGPHAAAALIDLGCELAAAVGLVLVVGLAQVLEVAGPGDAVADPEDGVADPKDGVADPGDAAAAAALRVGAW